MKIRTCAALLLAVGLPTAVFAVDYPEIEPNETKAQALTNGAFVLSAGDALTGISTGTSTAAATTTATADTFLVKTTPAALGIYRHRLAITTAQANTATIRGLSSTAAGPGTSDNTLQTSSSSTTTPARFVQWYGFGKEEQLYYRMTGSASTTGTYRAELSAPETVVPVAFASEAETGTISIKQDVATDLYDEDYFLFDSNFNVIAGLDSPPTAALTVALPTGTYYLAYARYNLAAGTASGSSIIQGTFQTGSILDFNDIVTSSAGTSATQPVGIDITHAGGTIHADGAAPGPYDVAWFTFTVGEAVTPTNPTGVGSASPSTVLNDGVATTTLSVTVTPGLVPTSSFLTTGSVTVDGSAIGGGTITLLDNGVAPDLVAGDLIFSADTTVAPGTPAGAATLPFLITDDQARNGTGNIALTVTTPPPGCEPGLSTLSFINVQGDGPIADPDNSIVTGDFGIAGQINTIRIAGRMLSNAIFNLEARIRAIAPDGSIYDIQPFTTTPSLASRDLTGFTLSLPTLEDGTGTWTFEFFESFNDSATPDVVWSQICFAADLTSTNPTATGVASPTSAVNDGSGVTTLSVTVVPGAEPTSTFLTTGSVTVDGSLIGAGTVTLLDNGVAPDAVAGDLIFTANAAVANGTAAGAVSMPFSVIDDQARTAGGNIAFTVTTPPPACPAGAATLTFSNVSSNAIVGGAGNSIVSGDFGLAGQINQFNVTGRVEAFAPSYRSEARVRATAPDGSFYEFNFALPASAGISDVTTFSAIIGLEDGTGTWSFEFFESFDDTSVNPDATWDTICFGAEQVNTPITATDIATSPVARDGVATSTLRVTVLPGAVPTSTGIAVVVDDSSVGGSGTLTLLDDGNAPDVAAGDNIFSGSTAVAYTTALGTATLPYTVTDLEGRSFSDALNFTVAEASGACCVAGGCVVTTIGDCLDVQGGTFAGSGTACTAPTALTTDGAGAFEDISTTGTLIADLEGDDDANAVVTIPFNFNYFGNVYTSIGVCTNGFAQFTGTSTTFTNTNIPAAGLPNDALYVLWDDHDFDVTGHAYTQLLGTIGVDARFIIQWNTVGQYNLGATPTDSNTYQIVLFEDGSFEYRYLAVAAETTADFTTIGFENLDGTMAYQSAETRDTLAAAAPVSFRANSTVGDTGVCGNGCPACAADYDGNGGVDGGDLGAFFADFEAGETCADVDGNGGVDGGDLGFFFFVFEAGGCE